MSQINHETLQHLVDQSRYYIEEAETTLYLDRLNAELDDLAEIQSVKTDGVKPTTNGNDNDNVLREDVPKAWAYRKQALENAPAHDGDHFEVPQIMD